MAETAKGLEADIQPPPRQSPLLTSSMPPAFQNHAPRKMKYTAPIRHRPAHR